MAKAEEPLVHRSLSWDEFIQRVREPRYPKSRRVFRGQRDPAWKLESALDRWARERVKLVKRELSPEEQEERLREAEKGFLKTFSDFAIGLPGTSTDPDHLRALGRHYGLNTRLLDWTASPFVAAFFSCVNSLTTWTPNSWPARQAPSSASSLARLRCGS